MPYTMAETMAAIEQLVKQRQPALIITANLNYAMLCANSQELRDLNQRAAFLLADGMPMVWWSRWIGRPLPERVAGSDMMAHLASYGAARGWRFYLLGAGPGVAERAGKKLQEQYPGLVICGTECPPFRTLTTEEIHFQRHRILAAKPDILLVAFGQPKGERWILQHMDELQVPVSIQVGATLDFVAGIVSRAPRWMQITGMEWLYRLLQEPKRLVRRYFDNIAFIVRAFFQPKYRAERMNQRPK
ncbi:MAG: WecB/TagA/CpsF family glycosyltransferase [Zavarzinella sp.]